MVRLTIAGQLDMNTTALETAKQRLIAVPNSTDVYSLLVETTGRNLRQTPEPSVLDQRFATMHLVRLVPSSYRKFGQFFHQNGEAVIACEPTLDAHGKPITLSDGSHAAIQEPVSRVLYAYGDYYAHATFASVATALGQAIEPSTSLAALVDRCSLLERDAYARWMFILFDLAWAAGQGKIAGAGFSAQKQIYLRYTDKAALGEGQHLIGDGARFPVDQLGQLRETGFPLMEHLEPTPDPPDWFYSVLDDVIGASIGAIDVLLTHLNNTATANTPTAQDKQTGLVVDAGARIATWNGTPLSINSHADFTVLAALADAQGAIVSYRLLLKAVDPERVAGSVGLNRVPDEVKYAVAHIKAAFRKAGCRLRVENVKKTGYRLRSPDV